MDTRNHKPLPVCLLEFLVFSSVVIMCTWGGFQIVDAITKGAK